MASQAWLESEHKRLTEENLELRRAVTGGPAVSPAVQDASPPTLPQAVVEELERLRESLNEALRAREGVRDMLAEVAKERDGLRQELSAFGTQKRVIEDGVAKIIAVCVPADRQDEAKQMLAAAFADADATSE